MHFNMILGWLKYVLLFLCLHFIFVLYPYAFLIMINLILSIWSYLFLGFLMCFFSYFAKLFD